MGKSTARVSLAEVFHPWVHWEGYGSGLESLSGDCASVWKSRILPPWDWGLKTCLLNGLGHNRTKAFGSWAEIGGVHTNFSRSIFPVMSKSHASGCLDAIGVWELLQDLTFFEQFYVFVCGILKSQGRTSDFPKTVFVLDIGTLMCLFVFFVKNIKFSKIYFPFIHNELVFS